MLYQRVITKQLLQRRQRINTALRIQHQVLRRHPKGQWPCF